MTINFGDTLTFKATIRDEGGAPITSADAHLITVLNTAGTIIETKDTCTNLGGGNYEVKITLPTNGVRGVWFLKWMITVGTESEVEYYPFKVRNPT